jgi:D-glycero-D-manno-heptose 1,7-bisphosphate phosphatase
MFHVKHLWGKSMKVVILDRDGVINQDSADFIKSPDEWIPIPGSLEAIARLNHAGYQIVIATNQSGIGRGLFDIETLNRIHDKMHRMIHEIGGHIEAVFFCQDTDDANPYRKPNPGMLEDIAERLKINLVGIPVIGDALRDIKAAQAVGAMPVLVRTGKGEATLKTEADALKNIAIFDDLAAAAEAILLSPSARTPQG